MAHAVDSLAKSLQPKQKLVLINTYPIIDKNPLRINHGYIKNTDYKFQLKTNKHNLATIDSISKLNKNVVVWDISEANMYKDAPYYHDTLIYYDDRHINKRGAYLLERELEEDFKKKILPIITHTL